MMDNQPKNLGIVDKQPAPGMTEPGNAPKYGLHRILAYFDPPLWATGVFLLFIVARYMNWGARREIFRVTRFEFLLGIILGVTCTVLLNARPQNMRPAKKILISLGVLFLAILVQIPFAADPTMAQFIFQERVLKSAMLTYFIVVLIQSPRGLRWFLLAFLFACFYVTQESVQGLISGGLYWENQGVMRLHGSVRMYAHPNSLAGLAMGTIPFIIFLFPVLKNKIVRLGLLALFSTSITCVIFSGSRTAYVAVMAFALFWWAISPHKIRFLVIGLVVMTVAYVSMPEQYQERLKSITGQEAEGHSKESRLEVMGDAWKVFLAHPAGVGVASFPAMRASMFGRRQDTHNLYLEVATNLGLQGLVVFLIFVGTLFWGYRHAYLSLVRQKRQIVTAVRTAGLKGPLPKALRKFVLDLDLMLAVCKATAGFIFIRLILGFFGMDLYEVYWWFGGGLAITLLHLDNITRPKTRAIVEMIRLSPGHPG